MKVHITLVGGQPAPIYHGIVATNPDKVVYIYSQGSQSVLDTLKNEIDIPCDDIAPLSPTDPKEILLLAESLAEKYANDEITLNISSGLKSWSHLFGRVFDNCPNASIVYMDQNNVLWDYRTMEKQEGFEFDMEVLFRLQGNGLTHYMPFSEYNEEDKRNISKIIAARSYNCGQFNKLTTVLKNEWNVQLSNCNSGSFELSSGVFAEWEKPDFVRLSLSTARSGIKEFEIESPHAVRLVFNSGWFECKIATMLSHWRWAKDIRLNCIFPPQTSDTGNGLKYPKNEIDIIINTGQKILFVECKTKIANSTDIDKFRTAVKNYGGMGSKALFITDIDMNDLQKEKCKESKIIQFSLQNSGPNKEQELFKLIESELFNINVK